MQKNFKRLVENMNKVAGTSLNEFYLNEEAGSTLPPGFSASDFTTLEKDIEETPCETGVNEADEDFLGANAKEISAKDLIKSFKNKLSAHAKSEKQGIGPEGRVHSTTLKKLTDISNLKDRKTGLKVDPELMSKKKYQVEPEDIGDIDLDTLRDILITPPADDQLLGQNKKMLKSNFYNISLPAMKSLIYSESTGKWYVVRVCDKAGECVNWCYAQMGRYVMFDGPIRTKMQKLNYLINHWEEWRDRVIKQIIILDNSDEDETIVRWHDAGDFISAKYLQIAFDVARATPDVVHYAYTKEVEMVKNSQDVPPNMEFKFSQSGKEDDLILPEDPKGVTVPEELFSQFLLKKPANLTPDQEEDWKKKGQWNFSPESWQQIKQNIANDPNIGGRYNIDIEDILTHDEYMEMEHNRKDKHERKWYVIGKPGDTDIPASRKDTLGILNLLHK